MSLGDQGCYHVVAYLATLLFLVLVLSQMFASLRRGFGSASVLAGSVYVVRVCAAVCIFVMFL